MILSASEKGNSRNVSTVRNWAGGGDSCECRSVLNKGFVLSSKTTGPRPAYSGILMGYDKQKSTKTARLYGCYDPVWEGCVGGKKAHFTSKANLNYTVAYCVKCYFVSFQLRAVSETSFRFLFFRKGLRRRVLICFWFAKRLSSVRDVTNTKMKISPVVSGKCLHVLKARRKTFLLRMGAVFNRFRPYTESGH